MPVDFQTAATTLYDLETSARSAGVPEDAETLKNARELVEQNL